MNNTNEKIWKTVKPFLSDKATTFPTISWVQNDEIISDEPDFTWFQISFEIKINKYSSDDYSLKTPFEIAIKKYQHYQSIKDIKENIANNKAFISYQLSERTFQKEILTTMKKWNF